MNTTTRPRLGIVLLLMTAGCVGPVEIAPLPYAHPANPGAPAGAVSDVGSMLGPQADAEGEPTSGAGMHHAGKKTGAAAEDGKYECPMHAEVRSHEPGRCPVCGMRLVKKGDATDGHEDHER